MELAEFIKDRSHSLVDRIESYQDIISLEIGDTPLTRMRNVERETGLRQLYIKFEGGNPSGTQKDRIAFAQCLDAMRRGYDTISVATCGNFGAATAQAAFLAGLHCKVFIPETYHTDRISEMASYGAEVIRFPGSYEDNVYHSQQQAKANRWYDANPGEMCIRDRPYANATVQDIFTSDQLDKSNYLYTYTFQTTLFRNEGKSFVATSLPYQVQLSPVFDILINDFNKDGLQDILMAGNFKYSEPETGEMDGGNGTLLFQQPDGTFVFQSNLDHGFWAQGEVRDCLLYTS